MYRSGRELRSLAVGALVAKELVEVASVCHLPEPGEGAQPYMPLTYLAKRSVNGVFLGLGPEHLGGHGKRFLVNLYGCLRYGHQTDLLSTTARLPWMPNLDI